MPPVRRSRRDSQTKPSLGLQERRLWQQRNKQDEKWNARLKELLQYKSEHGNCNVPVRQGKLGRWVNRQRSAYMADSLAQDRIDRLNSIGFKWALKSPGSTVPWETRLEELINYKAKHGECNVPQKQGKLGTWVGSQRTAYRAGSLLQDRIDRLDSIGFKWSLKEAALPWETRFKDLVQYKEVHGDCNVPRRQGQLGIWVETQRNTHKKGKLSHDRIDRLNCIGFDWTPPIGGSRKTKAPPCTRKQSLSRKERPSPSTNVDSLSVGGGGARGVETENDDEVDEIGAFIYDQVMQQRLK